MKTSNFPAWGSRRRLSFCLVALCVLGIGGVSTAQDPAAPQGEAATPKEQAAPQEQAAQPQGEVAAQEEETKPPSFATAQQDLEQRLELSLQELATLRETIANEKLPLSRKLRELENELSAVRQEYQKASRDVDQGALELIKLQDGIKAHENQASHLSTLVTDYLRGFEARLHVAEVQRYHEAIDKVHLARENTQLSAEEVFAIQAELMELSLERLHEALDGTSFEGRAIDADGTLWRGRFTMMGPAAMFSSEEGGKVGTAVQKLGSLEPALIAFAKPEDASAALQLAQSGEGLFPLDPTLGNAHKVEATQETLLEHISKGGNIMVPIFVMAGAAFLVVIYKWLSFLFVRRPSQSRLRALLQAIERHDDERALELARAVGGPTGVMLAHGAQHLHEPRELIEEIMYEDVLSTKLRLNSFLPFIAICASSAPLLGLLGTVTGIMNTFKLITVFGSGDVKMLSAGISEALITTEYGLIVAIPSLLLHALLSRKAKGILDHMERAAVQFVNQVAKSKPTPDVELLPREGFIAEETLGDDPGFDFVPAMRQMRAAKAMDHSEAPRVSAR